MGNARRLSHNELLLFADYSCISADPHGSVDPPALDQSLHTLKFVILEGRPHLYTEYTCSDGYELENDKRAYAYCKRKAWIGDLPKCIPGRLYIVYMVTCVYLNDQLPDTINNQPLSEQILYCVGKEF